jgi:hypothetical protein
MSACGDPSRRCRLFANDGAGLRVCRRFRSRFGRRQLSVDFDKPGPECLDSPLVLEWVAQARRGLLRVVTSMDRSLLGRCGTRFEVAGQVLQAGEEAEGCSGG